MAGSPARGPEDNQARSAREAELRTRYPRSRALAEKARSLIPGGHHLSGRALVDFETTAAYFERGRGATLYDVDGHEYVDYLMAFGAQLLGYARPEVETAVHEQAQRFAPTLPIACRRSSTQTRAADAGAFCFRWATALRQWHGPC